MQRLPLLVAGRVDGRHGQLEVLGAVVVQHQEHVVAADDGVLDAVLDALAARRDDPELAGRVVGVEDAVLAGDLAAAADDEEAVAAGAADRDPEALVGLVVDQDVLGRVGAEPVPPDLVGPPGVVDGRVEEVLAGEVPGGAVRRAGDLVRQQLAGARGP